MKTFLSNAILLSFLSSLNLIPALGQPAPTPELPDPNVAPSPGVLPTPSAAEPIGVPYAVGGSGGGGVGGGVFDIPRVTAGRYSDNSPRYGYHGASAGCPTAIHFSPTDAKNEDALQEDLNVMSLLLQKKLEESVGENSLTYRMGIPLLLRSDQRSIESLYLDGFGVLFIVNANIPLVAPPASKPKEKDNTTGSDEWDRARRELYGGRETDEPMNAYGTGALPYDAGQVDALKLALLDSLKNAANIRGLKSDEWVVVSVFGAEGMEAVPATSGGFGGSGGGTGGRTGRPGGPSVAPNTESPVTGRSWSTHSVGSRRGRGTVLTVRVKKSDAELFAKGKLNFEQFEQKATLATYLGPAGNATSATWRGGSFPGRYPMPPAGR